MNIPQNCKPWEIQMDNGSKEKRILDNIRQDPCISEDTEKSFFEHIANQKPPQSPKEALDIAYNIILNNQESFLCQGKRISNDTFINLIRIESVSSIWYKFDPGYFRGKGIREKNLLKDSSIEDIEIYIDDLDDSYPLGNQLGIVWVTDWEDSKQFLNDPKELIDRLGIQYNEDICIIIQYERNDIDVFVPSSFDGIDNENFSGTVDCERESGLTKPISQEKEGLMEAIHHATSVKPISIKASSLS